MKPIPDNGATGVFGDRTDLPLSVLWPALVDKVRNPGKYLPGVEAVRCTDNADGSVYREMSLAGGITMRENIYTDASAGRVEFRVVDKPFVVVNRYDGARSAVEYRLEDADGACLGWFVDGREGTAKAIAGQYERAREMQAS